jgi:hypothetical protein
MTSTCAPGRSSPNWRLAPGRGVRTLGVGGLASGHHLPQDPKVPHPVRGSP